jgi:hypothetical protein
MTSITSSLPQSALCNNDISFTINDKELTNLVICGTGSSSSISSSILVSSSAAFPFALSRCLQMSKSILSRMANFAALCQISVKSAPEYPCALSKECQVYIRSDQRLVKSCLEDQQMQYLIRKWDINKLIKITRVE